MAGAAAPPQTQEDIVPPAPVAIGYRLGGVLLAPAVAVAMHLILVGPFGVDLVVPESPGSSTLATLNLLTTVLATLAIGLAGWLAITLLERGLGNERGRGIWMWVAFGVFVVSLLPIGAMDITEGQGWGLVALHSAVALVLIPSVGARKR